MKKLIALLLAVMVVMSLAVNASACTPRLKIPKVPQISSIRLEPKLDEGWDEILISKEE